VGTPEAVYDRPASMLVASFNRSPPMKLEPIYVLRAADSASDLALPAGTDKVGLRPDALLDTKPVEPIT
ncbi:sn-glycerol-3-phosphate ABC transporter ATP-binding protein UgpC, partial [Rhizobium leguminosarum]